VDSTKTIPATPGNWSWYSMADAYAPRPPVRYAVNGLFQVPSLNVVYGAPGSLKSMLVADMLFSIMTGRPWLEPVPGTAGNLQGLTTTAGPVAWVDLDNGSRRTHDRFEAFGRAYNVPPDAPFRYVSMPPGGLRMDSLTHAEQLTEYLVKLGVSALCVDNLSMAKGAADEVKDMTLPMSNLRWVCEWANVCIFTIHHQRKSNGTKGREGETLRGHSSIEAAIDVALLVDRGENGSLAVDLRATKERGATFPERSATFSYTWHPGTHELETARFWGIEAQQRNNPRAQEESDIEDAIMDALTMNSALNMTALAKETGYSRDKLRLVLTKLVNSARIAERQGRTTNERVFSL